MASLPNIPWIGPMRVRGLEEPAIDRVARLLASRRGVRSRASPNRRRLAVLGLAMGVLGALLLHDFGSRGFLRRADALDRRFPARPAGVPTMSRSTGSVGIAATVALAVSGSPASGAGNELLCFGPCIATPQAIDLAAVRDLQFGAAVFLDGSFLVWNYGIEDWGQFDVPASVRRVQQLEIGRHGLALLPDGTVVAWGANNYGEATPPPGLSGVRLVRVGEFHSVAVRQDNSVVCWGNNSDGQCSPPSGLGAITDVRSGSHSVALRSDATIRCWGWNGWGQCSVPADLGPVEAISVLYAHTVVLTTDKRVRCWGRNTDGQCNVPAAIGPVRAISAGGLHTSALLETGAVVCWGSNAFGQCGANGTAGTSLVVSGPNCTLVVKQLCPADVDQNNAIDGIDLAIVLGRWGTSGGTDYPGADIDGSGTVDGADLAQVLGSWGACP